MEERQAGELLQLVELKRMLAPSRKREGKEVPVDTMSARADHYTMAKGAEELRALGIVDRQDARPQLHGEAHNLHEIPKLEDTPVSQ